MCRLTSHRTAPVIGRLSTVALLAGVWMASHSLHAEAPATGILLSVQIGQRADDAGGLMPVEPGHVAITADTVLKRLDSMGYAKTRITTRTAKGFHVRIADAKPAESSRIASALQKVAKLELRKVHPRSEERSEGGQTLAKRVLNGGEIVPGYRAYSQIVKDEDGHETRLPILLNRRSAITGQDIATAVPSPQEEDALCVTLNAEGTDKMIALTKNMQPGKDRIAIVLDGEVLSAPVLMQVPLGKNFLISGLSEPGEVGNLAHALMCPLEFPILVEVLPAAQVPAKTD